MLFRSFARWSPLVLLGVLAACGSDTSSPTIGPPARIDAVSALSTTAQVGTAAPIVVVKVTDANGHALAGASVGFTVTGGNGAIAPRVAVSDSLGLARATWTLGTVAGANQLLAAATGVPNTLTFVATGTSGAVVSLSVTPFAARLLPGTDTVRITANALDGFGNVASPPPTFIVRDPTLLSVDASGLVHALRRGASTYVVATAGGKSDSVLVTVLATGQSVCTGIAAPLDLAVGQVVTDLGAQGICVHASSAGAEYALVPYFNAAVVSATTAFDAHPIGVVPLGLPSAAVVPSPTAVAPSPVVNVVPDYAFESRMRAQERREFPSRAPGARAWMAARRTEARGAVAAAAAAVPAIGDLLKLNANANDFCAAPAASDIRTGRVAAVTDRAIVVADTSNPDGGFTDADYRSIGVTFDTLVDPTDRAAFGDPSDIDNNGHVILFFTRAVNELTPSGSLSVTLGFFYQRDLFPKLATPPVSGVACPGSNAAEMFYLLVPDTSGVVNGNRRTKSQVVTFTNGTVAHEYQHLINASRRLYVNSAASTTEERWLDEGLSHIAEELNFFKASRRSTRTNIDATAFGDPVFLAAYNTFELNNFNRYKTYLPKTETQAPVGSDPSDDDLPTRGAIWNFLRFTADHLAGPENAFWFKLVNSTTTGIANLTAALGTPPNSLMRDWAISVFVDDNASNVDQRFLQPSWNLRSLFTNGGTSLAFPLVTRTLVDGTTTQANLAAGGVSFMRFSVANGADAAITYDSNGGPLTTGLQVALVRVK